jgi:molybdate transport system ATP-binding protein
MSPRLEVRLTYELPGFALRVAWESDAGVVALFGPSGSGKTLTLDCIAGLKRPGAGRVAVGGQVLFDHEARVFRRAQERRVGYVFQHGALFPHLTVAENIGFGLRGSDADRRRRRTAEVLDRLGLGELAGRRPRDLSGGQRQRVALGRALAPEPSLLLLDEPLSALDELTRRALRGELRALFREWGIPVVLVTHDLAEAYELADDVVVYDGGRVVQAGPKAELLWRPASEQVARLLGVRNVLHGTVAQASRERIAIDWRGQTLEAVNSPRRAFLPAAGSPIAFYVRPEYVRLVRKDRPAPAPDPHHLNVLHGAIVTQLDLGTRWLLGVRLDAPGAPAQGDRDLDVEVPRLVHEVLGLERDLDWRMTIHRGAVEVLPGATAPPGDAG